MTRFCKVNNLDIKKKTSLTLGLMAITILMIVPTTVTESYATSDSKVVWQLIYIKEETCSSNDTFSKVYTDLASKYFELYELKNINYDAKCMSESEYHNFLINEDTNLTILIYDKKLGEQILKPNDLDGIYVHTGNDRTQNHLVLLCDCSDFDSSYESTLTSWIFSHELSHFVLSYKGYSQNSIQERIHEIENEYDNCIGTNFGNKDCTEFKITIRPESSSKGFVVMAPYEPAIGSKLVNYISEDYPDSQVIDIQRNLAKMWMTNEIDDKAYANTLTKLVDFPLDVTDAIHVPFLEIPNGFVIAETSKPSETDWQEYLNPITEEQKNIKLLLEDIPFNLDSPLEESNAEQMPNWFKTRALLWSEKRISDKVFFEGVEHLVRIGTLNLD